MDETGARAQAIMATCFDGVKADAVQCEHCGKWFVAKRLKRNKRFCSNACKQAAYRERQNGWQAVRPG